MTRVLLLAGTAEARDLAARLALRADIAATASLAGVTEKPERYAIPTRVGGFGGAEALADYLRQSKTDALIDATHPYAARITDNAAIAAEAAGLPFCRLERPEWRPASGEAWIRVPDLAAAAEALPAGARAFLATGRSSLAAFAGRADVWFAARMVEPPAEGFPLAQGQPLLARPPFSEDDEIALFQRLAITHLVTKNAGGDGSRPKLDAARALGVAVIMIERPPPAQGRRRAHLVDSVDAALDWLDEISEDRT